MFVLCIQRKRCSVLRIFYSTFQNIMHWFSCRFCQSILSILLICSDLCNAHFSAYWICHIIIIRNLNNQSSQQTRVWNGNAIICRSLQITIIRIIELFISLNRCRKSSKISNYTVNHTTHSTLLCSKIRRTG